MDGLIFKRKSVLSDEHELQTLRDLCEHIRQRSLAQLPELLTQLETNPDTFGRAGALGGNHRTGLRHHPSNHVG